MLFLVSFSFLLMQFEGDFSVFAEVSILTETAEDFLAVELSCYNLLKWGADTAC